MEGIVYDDEQLPELEIEELLTLDDMLKHQPSFVSFTPEELHTLMEHLVGSDRRANTFYRLYRSLIDAKTDDKPLDNVVLKVAAKRKLRYGDEVDDDLLDYTTDVEKAMDAPNYTLQMRAMHRAMLPFELSETPYENEQPILREQRASILLDDGSLTGVLEDDPLDVKVHGAKWKQRSHTLHDYVADTHIDTRDTPFVEWKTGHPSALNEWITKYVRPRFASVLEELDSFPSLHHIKTTIGRYGYQWENLDETMFMQLRERVSSLPDKDASETEVADKSNKLKLWKRPNTESAIWDIFGSVSDRTNMLLSSDAKQRYEDMFGLWLQGIPPLPSSIPLMDPYDIAKGIKDGSDDLENASVQLKQWYHRWNIDIASRFSEKLRGTVPDGLQAALDAYAKRLKDAHETTASLNISSTFLPSYSEMQDIKIGNDSLMYDGNAYSSLGMVFEDIGEDMMQDSFHIDDIDEDADEMTEPSTELLMQQTPIWDDSWSEGAKEVMAVVYTRINKISQASGLPCNLDAYVLVAKESVVRQSRIQSLASFLPDVSLHVLEKLLSTDLKNTMSKIQDISNESLRNVLELQYPRIHREWDASVEHAMHVVMCEWILDLLSQSISGTLIFSVGNAMIQHIGLWSPFGPPLEEGSKTVSGILPYLLAVTETLYPSMKHDNTMHAVVEYSTRMRGDTILKLQERLKDLEGKHRNIDRAKQAKLSLLDAIMAVKAKQKVNIVPPYIQALLYLPAVIPAKRNASKAQRWVQGCCATTLNESFEADLDWKESWRDLYIIKQGLARKRWSQEPRRVLRAHPGPLVLESMKNDAYSRNTVPDSVEETPYDLVKLLEEQSWIPSSHLQMLTKRPTETNDWSRIVISQCFARAKASSIMQASKVMENTTMLLTFISRVAGIDNSYIASMQPIIKAVRRLLRMVKVGRDSAHVLTYCFTVACAMPSTILQSNINDPEGMTTQELGALREHIYQICSEYIKNGLAMSQAEVQRFITKKREQQKQISLSKMDVLSTQDRQILQDAKKLKLVRLVEADELKDTDNDADLEVEGENEFAMQSSDMDDTNADMLD